MTAGATPQSAFTHGFEDTGTLTLAVLALDVLPPFSKGALVLDGKNFTVESAQNVNFSKANINLTTHDFEYLGLTTRAYTFFAL